MMWWKKENAWRGKRKIEKKWNDKEVVTIEENKETKDEKKTTIATKMKEKNL